MVNLLYKEKGYSPKIMEKTFEEQPYKDYFINISFNHHIPDSV